MEIAAPIDKHSFSYKEMTGQRTEWTPKQKPRIVTATTNVNPLDDLHLVDCTSGAVTLNLETAVGCDGRQHMFKKIDSSSNAMTIDGLDSELIDTGATVSTAVQGITFWLKSTGIGWASVVLLPGTAPGAGTVTSVNLTDTNDDTQTASGGPITTSGTLDIAAVDAGADKLVGWDDSAGKKIYFALGTGLSTTGDTLNVTTNNYQWLQFAITNQTDTITAGTAKLTTRFPACTVLAVRASLKTASTSGGPFTVDINENGTTILSTKLTIDDNEKTSTTAATAAVISDSTIADDAEITFDIDDEGSGAVGLIVTMKVQWT